MARAKRSRVGWSRPSVSPTNHTQPQRGPSSPPSQAAQLRWPSVCDDLFHFPKMWQVKRRCKESGRWHDGDKTTLIFPLSAFTSAVKNSQKCILVLDPHFDKVGVDALLPALEAETSRATDIRLLTGSGKCEKEELRRLLELSRNTARTTSDQVEILWSTRKLSFLHDRFAVVDDDLWHFGSTVGGGHRGLTAASGPWPEGDTHGKRFFEECWRKYHA